MNIFFIKYILYEKKIMENIYLIYRINLFI